MQSGAMYLGPKYPSLFFYSFTYFAHYMIYFSGFGGLVVSMLASGTQDSGFDPGRSRRIFRAKKSTACLPWGGGK